MAFVVDRAAMHAGEHHFPAFFVVQVDAGFQTAEGTGYIIHDVVDELIEVEDRSDLLRRLLQLLQLLHLIDEQRAHRNGGDGSRDRGHGIKPFLTRQVGANETRSYLYRMPRSMSTILSWGVRLCWRQRVSAVS